MLKEIIITDRKEFCDNCGKELPIGIRCNHENIIEIGFEAFYCLGCVAEELRD